MGIVQELLLGTDTAVTCPRCEHEFSLEQGFAKKALETLTHSSRTALSVVRETERAVAEKRAQAIVAEQEKTGQQELSAVRKLMAEQSASHERTLAEMGKLSEQQFKPQIDALTTQLQESRTRLAQMDQCQQAFSTRSKRSRRDTPKRV